MWRQSHSIILFCMGWKCYQFYLQIIRNSFTTIEKYLKCTRYYASNGVDIMSTVFKRGFWQFSVVSLPNKWLQFNRPEMRRVDVKHRVSCPRSLSFFRHFAGNDHDQPTKYSRAWNTTHFCYYWISFFFETKRWQAKDVEEKEVVEKEILHDNMISNEWFFRKTN